MDDWTRSCDTCGEFINADKLYTHPGECSYKTVECANECGLKLYKRDIINHEKTECLKRYVKCEDCKENFYFISMRKHNNVCSKTMIKCPNNCDVNYVQRNQMKLHLESVCLVNTVPCNFKFAQCEFRGTRDALKTHSKESYEHHLLLLGEMIYEIHQQVKRIQTTFSKLNVDDKTHTENKFFSSRDLVENGNEFIKIVKQLLPIRSELEDNVTSIQNAEDENRMAFDEMKQNTKTPMKPLNIEERTLVKTTVNTLYPNRDLTENVNEFPKDDIQLLPMPDRREPKNSETPFINRVEVKKSVENEKRYINENNEDIKNFNPEGKGEVKKIRETVEKLFNPESINIQLKELAPSSENISGEYLWTIIDENMNRTQNVYSSKLYSSRDGYKMKIILYPRGYGRGTHLTVGMQMVPGDFDDQLRWPFGNKITFILLDQTIDETDEDHIIKTITPDVENDIEFWKRPLIKANKIKRIQVASPEQMDSGKFIRDDSLRIRIVIEK